MRRFLILTMTAALTCALPTLSTAEAPTGPSFKRIKPPAPGTRKLINIQIEPVATVERVLPHRPNVPNDPVEVPTGPSPSASGSHEWFWEQVSPSLAAADLRKLQLASATLDKYPSSTAALAPGAARLSRIVDSYGPQILAATAGTQVSPALVLSVISVESAGRPKVKSSAGAVGLMQLMPATAKRFGVEDRTDPQQNIRGGVKYLEFLLDEFAGDAVLALAAYNAGEGAVRRNNGVPNYAETRAYVPKVIAAWQQARLLCLQPPVRATDGCLFTGLRVASQ